MIGEQADRSIWAGHFICVNLRSSAVGLELLPHSVQTPTERLVLTAREGIPTRVNSCPFAVSFCFCRAVAFISGWLA